MSWQAASFLILGAVLLGGFAWYERSRPSSQVVALVAALAALAVAGRIAFAALPNVKPTTDVAIFAGYALGPAPGFAVGALAGLVSNFWFGQGPWTPWQMAAWGACGVLGAALALRRRRPPGRLLLAAVCGLAGIGFGALMNFYEMSYGGDLSLQRFLALESRAVPFDAAHAIGNATLALLAGPAMVRMLVRFRTRFEWRASTATAALLLALTLGVAALAPARARAASETGRAAGWLVAAQNGDGGWGDTPARGSNAATTCWAMLGLEAAGRNPLDVALGAVTPVDYLRANLHEIGTSGDFARTILALEGAGVDPRSFGGHNLVAALLNRRRRDGSFEGWPVTTAFAVLALRQAGATGGLARSTAWLISVQNSDGGWGDTPGSPSTADDTGAAIEAIPSTQAARRGLAYLRSIQRPNGGFAAGSGPVNAQSTAWAAQGMLAAGADPGSAAVHDALAYIAARQASDGHFRYSSSSDQTPVWVTGEALAAAAAEPFPIEPPPRAPGSALHPVTPAAPNGHVTSASKPPGGSSNGSPANEVVPYAPAPSGSPSSEDLLKSLRKGAGGPAGAPGYLKPPMPASPGTAAIPPATSPGGEAAPAPTGPPALARFVASGPGPGPAPWAPLGIGLAAAALALGGVVLLGRRLGW